jgi:hypothetical protein
VCDTPFFPFAHYWKNIFSYSKWRCDRFQPLPRPINLSLVHLTLFDTFFNRRQSFIICDPIHGKRRTVLAARAPVHHVSVDGGQVPEHTRRHELIRRALVLDEHVDNTALSASQRERPQDVRLQALERRIDERRGRSVRLGEVAPVGKRAEILDEIAQNLLERRAVPEHSPPGAVLGISWASRSRAHARTLAKTMPQAAPISAISRHVPVGARSGVNSYVRP